MRHFFFIDPLKQLNIKKDSSLYMASKSNELGYETFLLFPEQLSIHNNAELDIECFSFKSQWEASGPYLKSVDLNQKQKIKLAPRDIIHMRLDPPFDSRYLRYLWLLEFIRTKWGVKIVNSPKGIMNFHEKLFAYSLKDSVKSYVGENLEAAIQFVQSLTGEYVILKPLDLYSGLGVEKVEIKNFENKFKEKIKNLNAPIIVQPFLKEVEKGELRVITFKGKYLGAILKKPKSGDFISNIAAGGSFEKVDLTNALKSKIETIAHELLSHEIDLIAFDVLGETVTEVNLTCPGLLVEVAYAHQKDLAGLIINSYLKS